VAAALAYIMTARVRALTKGASIPPLDRGAAWPHKRRVEGTR
jgi:hypothetical protein